jgi:predicted O-linked N-acetylglucosamine transferase (SPINDLY family)
MGIPVVTLVGKTHVSRVGLSILSTVGLTELVTNTPEDYVKTVIQLANNPNYLQFLRKTIRERLKQSPLLDGLSFTQELESVYRVIWKNWCA